MRQYVIRRILQAVPLLVGISLLTFAIVHYAPGDPVTRFLDPRLSITEMQARRRALGLDDPFLVQYLRWLGNFLQGDLGQSFADGRPVLTRIMERMPATLELGLYSFLLTLVIAVPVGVLGAVRQYSIPDYAATTFAFIGLCIPVFVFGMLLQLVFSVHLGWLPLLGRTPPVANVTLGTRIEHLILPVLTLALNGTAGITRYMRASMLEVIRQDYIRTARSKGVHERLVVYRHALRNALLPIITILGLNLPGLISGAVLTESVFAWPGMGRLAVQSVSNRDFPTIMGLTMIFSVLIILGNLLADIMYGVVDPRIRYD
ncbi:MAG TPA: ABC transporter permease [Bacillota bacterium]